MNYQIPLSVARFALNEDSDGRDMLEKMRDDGDGYGNNYRIIHESILDETLADELESDEYVLGCFNADFLAGVTDLPREMIEACQKAEAFEAVGKAIIDGGWLEDVAKAYASADGYGHHFAHYDFNEYELSNGWRAYRIN